MKLTIITPTLNAAGLIDRAVQSVRDQAFREIEHLILDGGSTDGTLEIAGAFPHLRIISQPDEGIYDAMNRGVAAATGDWIYFLGADDYLADNTVLTDLRKHLDQDEDVVYGDVTSTRFGGRYGGPFDATQIRLRNICHQAIFFRRRVFQEIGVFNTGYRAHADWDFNMRWMLNGGIRRKYIDRVIAVYADGGFSSVQTDMEFHKDRLFRYLSYGKGTLSLPLFAALLCKDMAMQLKSLDVVRLRRSLELPFAG